MKKIFTILFVLLLTIIEINAQTTVYGVVTDASTGETLIGANILFKEGIGGITDFDGKFSFQVANGEYDVKISYVGYKPLERKITANGKAIQLKVSLEQELTLNEINVVADVARERETPVAFTNVTPIKIEEELGGRDLPMILNRTPGVYATQAGGGDGDARITIRGFNQRNVAVMLDGIPVNDMENGWVYWSNWFGLDAVTRTIQVQRGLGASKLAIPSVGGTMNILSKGIEAKRGGNITQQIGSDAFIRTSIGYTTGKLPKGWGITVAGSYKQGDGWADATWTKGWFYFARIDKSIKNHLISISAMGAPQSHAQRSYQKSIATYSKDYAASLSGDDTNVNFIDTTGLSDYGLKYNAHSGFLERWTFGANKDTIHADVEELNEKVNYYHKPQFSIKDSWTVNDKLFVSNILYLSIGSGGGTGTTATINPVDGTMNWQKVYNTNYNNRFDPGRAGTAIRTAINNHYWYGFLSTVSYHFSESLSFSGGIDLRNYKGEHYQELYDMLGGQFFYDEKEGIANNNSLQRKKYKGDKISYYNDGLVRWGGLFALAEYKNEKWSAFINISTSMTSYKRVDYFLKKEIHLIDTVLRVGIKKVGNEYVPEEVKYQGNTYTINSPEAKTAQTDWESFGGFTVKGGANYNINNTMNVFFNAGYLSKAPRFNNVFNFNNQLFRDITNETIIAYELGYSIQTHQLALNLNGYYTLWKDKPIDRAPSVLIDGESYSANIHGMDALHKGIELDLAYKPIRQLEVEGLISIGDWCWTSANEVYIRDNNGRPLYDGSGKEIVYAFDAKGVHVGDAAQTQLGASIRYEIVSNLFVKANLTYFGRYFAEFDPMTLYGENAGRDSWQIPEYYLLDLTAGYSFDVFGYNMKLNFNVLNALDQVYISDATNNDQYTGQTYDSFDAKSAAVFFGLGRRYMASLKILF